MLTCKTVHLHVYLWTKQSISTPIFILTCGRYKQSIYTLTCESNSLPVDLSVDPTVHLGLTVHLHAYLWSLQTVHQHVYLWDADLTVYL